MALEAPGTKIQIDLHFTDRSKHQISMLCTLAPLVCHIYTMIDHVLCLITLPRVPSLNLCAISNITQYFLKPSSLIEFTHKTEAKILRFCFILSIFFYICETTDVIVQYCQ